MDEAAEPTPERARKFVAERYENPDSKEFAKDITPVGSNGGTLFSRPTNLRSDARMAARLISLGVVDEETAASLLRQAFIFAAGAAKDGNLRYYCSAMEVLLSAARIEQTERHKIMDKLIPDQQALTVNGEPMDPAQLWQSIIEPGLEAKDLEQRIASVADGIQSAETNGHVVEQDSGNV